MLIAIYSVDILYVESLEYFRLDVSVGESVDLLCNTSLTSNIMWTYDNDDDDDGYVDYVYWKGRVDREKPWLAVKSTADHFHSLVIADAEPKHSGIYDCYDGEGTRKVGYRLTVAGITSSFRDAVLHAWKMLVEQRCAKHRRRT